MRKPSIKMLVSTFEIGETDAKAIRAAMDEDVEFCTPRGLEFADPLIKGFGVEYIAQGRNSKSPAMEYVNMGDSYAVTLIKSNGSYWVGCWGNVVERGNYE